MVEPVAGASISLGVVRTQCIGKPSWPVKKDIDRKWFRNTDGNMLFGPNMNCETSIRTKIMENTFVKLNLNIDQQLASFEQI